MFSLRLLIPTWVRVTTDHDLLAQRSAQRLPDWRPAVIENFKLHVFRVVADTLNFSKAAEELDLSQPAVTYKSAVLKRDYRAGVRAKSSASFGPFLR
jgi:Bacterial regulatory helix-turn-helix protein, lysR family